MIFGFDPAARRFFTAGNWPASEAPYAKDTSYSVDNMIA